MRFKGFINEIIEEEISKFEQMGDCIRLKTLIKLRVLYTVVMGMFFVLLNIKENFSGAFWIMLIYFVLMYKTNNASVIRWLAKKRPDTPISEIIEGDMK